MNGEFNDPSPLPTAPSWLERTLEKNPSSVLLTDALGVIFHANPAACLLLHLPAQELLGQSFSSLAAWLQADWAALLFEQARLTLAPVSFEAYPAALPQGEALALSGWFNPILEQDLLSGMSITVNNIVQQQQANLALQQSQQRLALALEAADLSVLDWNIASDQQIVDDRLAHHLGFEADELCGSFSKLMRLVHPEDASPVLEQINQHLEGKTSLINCDLRLETSSKSWKWSSFTGRVVEHDLFRRPRRMVSVLRDITLNKQREEELGQQQRMLSQIATAAPVIIYLYDLEEYRDLYINRQFADLLGYPLDEATRPGTSLFRRASFHPDDAGVLAYTRQLYQQAADGEIVESEVRMRHYDGHWAWLHTRDTVFTRNPDGSARIVLGIVEDVTRQKLAEAELRLDRLRFEALYTLSQMIQQPESVILDYALEASLSVTSSRLGFLFLVQEEESSLTFHNCTPGAQAAYDLAAPPTTYASRENGPWGKALRLRRAVIHNQPQPASDPNIKDGGPPPLLQRHLNVPVFDSKRIVLIAGVSNKEEEYGDVDVRQVTLVMDAAWQLIRKKRMEEALHQSEERFRQLAESAQETFWIRDLQSRQMLYVSPGYQRIWGRSPESLLQDPESFLEAIHPSDLPGVAATIQRSTAFPRPTSLEFRILRPDGELCWVRAHVTFHINPDGRPERQFGVAEDVTARKEAEQALQAERTALARRVEEQTADLRIANAELERAARMKDEFLANMSHELRTPLNSILGSAEVLRERLLGDLNERQILSLNTIDESGRHLLSLINDVLDLSKIEAGMLTLDLHPTSVDQVCQVSLRMVRQAALKKQIAISFQFDNHQPVIQGDERRLKQILVNLLSNAVKFTPERGQVGLEVSTDPDAHRITFNVWDSGIGIAEHDLERLFKPFVQLDSGLSRQYEGTGLGLSLVHRLVDLYGGSIQVKSAPGEGSSFIVTLSSDPVDLSTPDQTGDAAPQDDHNLQGISVLVAEDNPLFLDTLTIFLSARGCRVTTAHSGREVLEQAHRVRPDAIVMDVQMPLMDGIEATRRLRSDPAMRSTPIIALTALAMPYDRQRCLAAGMNDCLSKPVNLSDLARVLHASRPK